MGQFSDVFITSLQNIAVVSDNLFEVEPPNNLTTYTLEVFKRLDMVTPGPGLMQFITLEEQALINLTPDNFAENTQLGFDIRNASQLRFFISQLLYIKIKAKNLILLSFDNEDSLTCQNWTLNINFNLNEVDEVIVTKQSEYNKIRCLDGWKSLINYDIEVEESPVRENVD